jgi:hypothetical protein
MQLRQRARMDCRGVKPFLFMSSVAMFSGLLIIADGIIGSLFARRVAVAVSAIMAIIKDPLTAVLILRLA